MYEWLKLANNDLEYLNIQAGSPSVPQGNHKVADSLRQKKLCIHKYILESKIHIFTEILLCYGLKGCML